MHILSCSICTRESADQKKCHLMYFFKLLKQRLFTKNDHLVNNLRKYYGTVLLQFHGIFSTIPFQTNFLADIQHCNSVFFLMTPVESIKLKWYSVRVWASAKGTSSLRTNWRLLTIWKHAKKSVWSNFFWNVKMRVLGGVFNTLFFGIKHKCWKNFLRKKKWYKKCPLFSFACSYLSLFCF